VTPRKVALLAAAAVAVVAAVVVVIVVETRPSPRPPRLLVGLDDDSVKWVANADGVLASYRELGVGAVRVWIPWHGAVRPRGVTAVYLARAESLAEHHVRVVLAIFGFARDAPLGAQDQLRYCGFVVRALRAAPAVRDVVIWNEANGPLYWPRRAGAPPYERLLARCRDAVHAYRRDAIVLDSTSSHHDPVAFLRALGAAYRASGRTRPIVDVFGHNPYPLRSDEAPDERHAGGFLGEGDYARLVATLRAAFRGTAQPVDSIWYLEDGFQSSVPADRRYGYRGRETEHSLASPRGEASSLAAALELAACQPRVHAFFNFERVDEWRLAGWQSGVIWSGGGRKPAFAAFRHAIDAVRDGCGQ
jgi:hypothetical protein